MRYIRCIIIIIIIIITNSHRIRDLFHLFRILLWRELHAQMAAKCLVAIDYFGSDIEADQPALR